MQLTLKKTTLPVNSETENLFSLFLAIPTLTIHFFSGQVYTWGKGDDYRLGHGNTESIKIPKLVEALNGKYYSLIFIR